MLAPDPSPPPKMDLAIAAVSDPKYSKYLAPLLLLADAFLSVFILVKIPCNHPPLSLLNCTSLTNSYTLSDTEIDWKAYMGQAALYLNGELDYVKLKGSTGPLVYPAGHVYVYSLLYKFTDHGRDIWKAQCIFAGLYLLMVAVVLAVYIQAKVCEIISEFSLGS